MYEHKSVCVVIPCYNESLQVTAVIDALPDFVDHVVCIDDASTDDTYAVLQRIAAEREGFLTVVRHDANGGVGKARVTGYVIARDEKWDLVAAMDGDGQMDPVDLPALLDPVAQGACDFSKGDRLHSGEAWGMMPKVRYLGNSMLSLMTKVVSGYWHIVDSQTGYAVISHDALTRLPLEMAYHKYGFPNDLLVMANVANLRVRDIPVRPVYGVGEKSSMKLWLVAPAIAWLLFRRFWWRLAQKYVIRDFHPLVFFYVFGFILLLAGCVIGLIEVWARAQHGGELPMPTMVLVALFVISGLQLLLWAMWFDQDYNKSLR
ncbi:MAG: glycosyltransferase family 2 protein [Coriobacteriia bacterium]